MAFHTQQCRKRFRGVAVVVGYQYPAAQRHGRRGWAVGCKFRRVCGHPSGQPHSELTAVAKTCAIGLDGAAMELDEALRQGQADSEAALRTVSHRVDL